MTTERLVRIFAGAFVLLSLALGVASAAGACSAPQRP